MIDIAVECLYEELFLRLNVECIEITCHFIVVRLEQQYKH